MILLDPIINLKPIMNRPAPKKLFCSYKIENDTFTKNTDIVDIKLRAPYPGNVLSNLYESNFEFDGVKVKSIESILQSLKIKDEEQQRKICALSGLEAKKISKGFTREKSDAILYWQGKAFRRDSEEFKNLINIAKERKRDGNDEFFEINNIKIRSIENLVKALKVNDIEIQKKICAADIDEAIKINSQYEQQFDTRLLYWQGKAFRRDSEEYQQLLKGIYLARYMQDANFRKALSETANKKLTHSIGKNNQEETILTTKEFIDNLEKLRANYE